MIVFVGEDELSEAELGGELPPGPVPREILPRRPERPITMRTLRRMPFSIAPYALGFRALQGGNPPRRWFAAQPQIPFRIHGLLLWGATKDTWITHCQVRLTQQLRASADPIPGLLFASELSFAELCARLRSDDGSPMPFRTRKGKVLEPSEYIEGWLSSHPEVAAHQLFSLPTLSPADQVSIEVEGPFHQMVFWGLGAVG